MKLRTTNGSSSFGENGSIRSWLNSLEWAHDNFTNHKVKIRDCITVLELLKTTRFNAFVDTTALPSHDRVFAIPFDKFGANATGTLNLLNGVRNRKPNCFFWHMSIHKVHSGRPTNLVERETRYDFAGPRSYPIPSPTIYRLTNQLTAFMEPALWLPLKSFARDEKVPHG